MNIKPIRVRWEYGAYGFGWVVADSDGKHLTRPWNHKHHAWMDYNGVTHLI